MSSAIWQTATRSLEIAALATSIATLLAVPVAFANARLRYPGKSLLEAIVVVPLVLPPTVVGYLIIASLGARGWVGSVLHSWFDYSILFRFEGAVLAAALVAFPLVYLPTRAGFAAIDRDFEDSARIVGAGPISIFWHVSLPLVRRALISGVMLAFARAIGEFGATVMVYGIRPGHTTLPVSVYLDYEQGEMQQSLAAVIVLCAISLAITYLYNRSTVSKQD